jgi:Spy/CpxP family protein refolding chaperone
LAQAQQRGRLSRFFGDNFSVGVSLLSIEKVQGELKLSGDQIGTATKVGEKLSQDRRALYEDLSREERRERGSELRIKAAEISYAAVMQIAETMDDAQKKRWREITLQVRGAAALAEERMAKRMELTEEQVKKLNDLTAKQREKMREAFRQSQGQDLSREERIKQFTAMVAETNKQRLAVLTDEQRAKFNEQQGEKFELPQT